MAVATFKTVKCTSTSAATEADCSHNPCWLSADITSTNTTLYKLSEPQNVGDPANYSYECWVRLEVVTAPDNKVENVKWHGPNTQPALSGGQPNEKLTVYVGTTDTGATPVVTVSSVATTRQDTTYYSAGTALTIPCDTGDGWLDGVGEQTDFCVTQLKIEHGSGQGNITPVLSTWLWEES